MSIKIAIADDHPVVVEGIRNLLQAQNNLEVIATYSSGTALLEGLEARQPDLLLLDVHFPDIRGNDLIRQLSPQYPELRILVLSSEDNVLEVKDMLQHGASGYVLKNVSLPVLLEAIEKVHAGEQYIEATLKESIFKSLVSATKPEKKVDFKLTQREHKILELLSKGYTNVEIGDTLFLSYRTIQNNRQKLYQKLGVHSTGELIRVAIERGLITESFPPHK